MDFSESTDTSMKGIARSYMELESFIIYELTAIFNGWGSIRDMQLGQGAAIEKLVCTQPKL